MFDVWLLCIHNGAPWPAPAARAEVSFVTLLLAAHVIGIQRGGESGEGYQLALFSTEDVGFYCIRILVVLCYTDFITLTLKFLFCLCVVTCVWVFRNKWIYHCWCQIIKYHAQIKTGKQKLRLLDGWKVSHCDPTSFWSHRQNDAF